MNTAKLSRTAVAAAIFGAALAVRLAYLAGWGRLDGQIVGDALEYHGYAVNLLDLGRYEGPSGKLASRMPGYPLFLAFCYVLFGRQPLAAQIVQSFIGAGTCVLIFLIVRRWFDRRWAVFAGLAATGYYDLLSPSAHLLSETLTTFFLTLIFWAWNLRPVPNIKTALGVGMAAAAAYFTRPEIGPYVVLLAGLTLLPSGGHIRWRPAVTILLSFLALALPWAARNQHVLGRPIITSTAGAMNVYLGIPRTVAERFGGLQGKFLEPKRRRLIDALPELESVDAYKRLTVELYRQIGVFEIFRALVFNLIIQHYPFLPDYDPTLAFLLPFWLWGAWIGRKNHSSRPLIALLGYLTAVYCVVAVMQARHRQILGSALTLLAMLGLRDLQSRTTPKTFSRALTAWAGFNAIVWFFAPRFRELALLIRTLI